eukprot:3455441-Rhodomonas_salina.3
MAIQTAERQCRPEQACMARFWLRTATEPDLRLMQPEQQRTRECPTLSLKHSARGNDLAYKHDWHPGGSKSASHVVRQP